jgi:N6-L-threonylcarbamoyladenine synthase
VINLNKRNILVLGIESSCDETSAAVVENGRKVYSNIISSQIEIHKKFGGVVPEIASRNHIENISGIIQEALDKANVSLSDIDLIGITHGPGLVGALLVGVSVGKALAFSINKPFIGVHHIAGHIAANYIHHKNLEPPFISLVVSGGHSHIILVKDYNDFKIIGQTRDDAPGEAFDKIARVLELGYPGGPIIDKLSLQGDSNSIPFPKIFLKDGSYDFSFSGLKTAVLNYINQEEQKGNIINKANIAASFQKAVVEVLCTNAIRATKEYGLSKLVLAGGVAANSSLRANLDNISKENDIALFYPSLELCTDNAAMIASAAYYKYIDGDKSDLDLNAEPGLKMTKK